MSFDPNHCWYLERRGIRERPNFLLVNAKDTIRLGRRKTSNDKHMAKGIEVSRQHCQFVRSGNAEDWENVRWSIVDLGGTNGTYVNQTRIPQNTPYALNHGDLIGIGHPESTSTRIDDNEKYVYIIKAPVSFSVPEDVMTVPDDEVQNEDDDTPPSSPCQVEIPRIPVPFQKDKAALPLNNDPPLTSGFKESKKLTLICVDPGETNRQEANTPVAVHSSSDKSKINRRSALEHRGLSQLRGHPTPTSSVPSDDTVESVEEDVEELAEEESSTDDDEVQEVAVGPFHRLGESPPTTSILTLTRPQWQDAGWETVHQPQVYLLNDLRSTGVRLRHSSLVGRFNKGKPLIASNSSNCSSSNSEEEPLVPIRKNMKQHEAEDEA